MKSKKESCVCIIPSRYGSTRLPAKPLAMIGSKPLIQHVWERACEARVFARIIVATDHLQIKRTVEEFGGEAAMTPVSLRSGTDRVAEVARRLREPLVMNLQGDEPFVSPRALARLVKSMQHDTRCLMGTLARRVPASAIASDPNAVKVVLNRKGCALYFSRSPIPYDASGGTLLQHLGVYLYRRNFLFRFASWPRTETEKRERLEQLRALEYGILPKVVLVNSPALSVDSPKDLQNARTWLRDRATRHMSK